MRYVPLASKIRPKVLDDIIGQEHLVGQGKLLTEMCNPNRLLSFILYGKSGVGKTSIAEAFSGTLGIPLYKFNASTDSKKDLQKISKESVDNNKSVLLFIDEIHRMTKPIQDYLLPFIEEGYIVLIGATTENPYISVNPALRSRTRILELKPLTVTNIKQVITRGLESIINETTTEIKLEDGVLDFLAHISNNDARTALNNLEVLVSLSSKDSNGNLVISKRLVEETSFKKDFDFGSGDNLYNTLSAFQKSLRGSSVDASLYYLASLLLAGELESACRRLMVCCYEDVGLANPLLQLRVNSAVETALKVGMPEARIPLSVAVIELALSPKSNTAYKSIDNALSHIQKFGLKEIPKDIMDGHYKGANDLGRAVNYKYPFDYDGNIVNQNYLPQEIQDINFFQPIDSSMQEEKYKKDFENIQSKLKD